MNKLIAIAGVVLITAGLASAKDLATYKATYEKEMENIILSHGMRMTEMFQQYTKFLDTLLAKVKKGGDLNTTTTVMEEIARFGTEKAMPKRPSALLDIQHLQSSFTKQASARETQKAKQVISLTSKYDQALERLQRSLVSSDKLDDAKAVQEERKRVRNTEVVSAAKTLISACTAPEKPKATSTARKRATLQRKEQSIFDRSGAKFRVLEGKVKGLKKGCSLYTDKNYTMKERPKELSSARYIMAPFSGCKVVCEKDGIAFAIGLCDVHQKNQTDRVISFLKDMEWIKAEDVSTFVLFYTNGADRMGKLYWREIKEDEELTFPNGTILCYKNR